MTGSTPPADNSRKREVSKALQKADVMPQTVEAFLKQNPAFLKERPDFVDGIFILLNPTRPLLVRSFSA